MLFGNHLDLSVNPGSAAKEETAMDVNKGYVQVYTGNGKGKTTAALGLTLRAVGAGLRVYIAQFVKGADCSELHALRLLGDAVTIEQFGRGFIAEGGPGCDDMQAAQIGIKRAAEILHSDEYDLVILDEANVAAHYNLLSVDELLSLIDSKPARTELVITGRHADPRIVERADLVTEMVEVKHYYDQGVDARVGIEK